MNFRKFVFNIDVLLTVALILYKVRIKLEAIPSGNILIDEKFFSQKFLCDTTYFPTILYWNFSILDIFGKIEDYCFRSNKRNIICIAQ